MAKTENQLKAYSVLSSVGQTRHIADSMNDSEAAELAAIHDQPEGERQQLMDEFWARRQERLEEGKATDDVQPAPLPTPESE